MLNIDGDDVSQYSRTSNSRTGKGKAVSVYVNDSPYTNEGTGK